MLVNIIKRLAVQALVDGLPDHGSKSSLILALPDKLWVELSAKQSSRGQTQVRRLEDRFKESLFDQALLRRIIKELIFEKKNNLEAEAVRGYTTSGVIRSSRKLKKVDAKRAVGCM